MIKGLEIDICSKKVCKCKQVHEKDTQYSYSSGECKSIPQWPINSHILIWISFKIKELKSWWRCKFSATMENSVDHPQEIKHRATIWPSYSTSGYIAKKIKLGAQINICTT